VRGTVIKGQAGTDDEKATVAVLFKVSINQRIYYYSFKKNQRGEPLVRDVGALIIDLSHLYLLDSWAIILPDHSLRVSDR
jgi:hypothetical protein